MDATRKGNHARFCNHSNTPNIEPRMSHVNGGMRIGFFAKHDIVAQSEVSMVYDALGYRLSLASFYCCMVSHTFLFSTFYDIMHSYSLITAMMMQWIMN